MSENKKIFGLFTLFIVLTLAMYSMSIGQKLDENSTAKSQKTLSGTVIDTTTQQRVPGATVSIPALGKQTQTGGGGEFAFTNIESGEYTIRTIHKNYQEVSNSVEVKAQNSSVKIELISEK